MKGLIISSGTIKDYDLLKNVINEHDFVLCADGGMDHLLSIGMEPNLIIGDLDSISSSSLNYIKERSIPIKKFPSKKDATDTELAVDYLIEKGFNEITLMGVTGSRLDHTIANIYLLKKLSINNIIGKIVDDNNTIILLDEYQEINFNDNVYISILPISTEGIVISLTGFLYDLDRANIDFGSTIGISNRVTEIKGIIQLHSGKGLLFMSKD